MVFSYEGGRVAKSDLNSTEAYIATKKLAPKMALKLPKIAKNYPKLPKLAHK